jgi:hypothetical protein
MSTSRRWPRTRRCRPSSGGAAAVSEANRRCPSSVSTTWRGLWALLCCTATIPASALKSATLIAVSSEYRQPVSTAPRGQARRRWWCVRRRFADRPRAKSRSLYSRSRARMTVLADHGAPLGVSTWQRRIRSLAERQWVAKIRCPQKRQVIHCEHDAGTASFVPIGDMSLTPV